MLSRMVPVWPDCAIFESSLQQSSFVKVAQAFSNILGYCEEWHFYMLNWCIYFLGNFWRKLGYYLLQHLVTLDAASPSDYLCIYKMSIILKECRNSFLLLSICSFNMSLSVFLYFQDNVMLQHRCRDIMKRILNKKNKRGHIEIGRVIDKNILIQCKRWAIKEAGQRERKMLVKSREETIMR